MVRLFVAQALIILLTKTLLNGQVLTEIKLIQGFSYEIVYDHVNDSEGNSYIAFHTNGSEINQPVQISDTLFSSLSSGTYLVKISPQGKILWIQEYGTIFALALDKEENILITGVLSQYAFTLTKLTSDGEKIWEVKEYTGSGMWSLDMIIDAIGNIYVTGTLYSSNAFGLQFNGVGCCPPHDFLVKFNSSGNFLWIKASEPKEYSNSTGRALAFDNNGNILLAGQYVYGLFWDTFSLPYTHGKTNSYIVKISPAGEILTLLGIGIPTGHCVVNDIAVDENNEIYIGGGYTESISLGNQILSSKGEYDAYLAKFSISNELKWVIPFGSEGRDIITNIEVISDGIILSGTASGSIEFGDKSLGQFLGTKAIVSRVNKSGGVVWIKEFGNVYPQMNTDTDNKYGYNIFVVSDHCFYVSGHFSGILNTPNNEYSAKEYDGFTGLIVDGVSTLLDVGPDQLIKLCGDDEVSIPLCTSEASIQGWIVVKGTPPIIENQNSETIISSIASGETILKWYAQECELYDEKIITIERVIPPPKPNVNAIEKFCSAELHDASIFANGPEIYWYTDVTLLDTIASGNLYKPSISDTLYVASTKEGCLSDPASVIIIVNKTPDPSVVENFEACSNTILQVQAIGENLKWYKTLQPYEHPQTEQALTISSVLSGEDLFYVSQTINGCESKKAEFSVLGLNFSSEDIFLINVITANDDGLNDSFFLPTFKTESCLGRFLEVSVINRWGENVFKSKERNFSWKPTTNHIVTGTYFYHLKFDSREFSGWISILE